MADLLDPKNDYVFKRLFADDPVLLCSLINAVRRDSPPVHVLTVSNPAIAAEELHGKYIILDLLADDPVRSAYDKLKALSADPETRWLAFQRERALLEEQTLLSEAREEGIENGVEKGRAEAQRETAERMLRLTQMDDATIAALSGLDQAEVAALRQAAR